ncbi:MAG: NTP transferase domain-containing protein [Balneola sp.]|nr:NTP transferase domain-containing protein [Balneola sp.]MBO6651548.1 NTP transferase domain-containing protein [Balneola sp.]MBO6710901.1 NTP transferase domain-containing protein [Balneola sp.]MBO6799589.1 NTP transferase domain-containing protein [Balneola sp.]MBO6870321.1 NTP transferase domain-containing protein [Balneola sp.]
MSEKAGLILAAGFGSRLEGVSAVTEFKPLTPVAGKPLIFRTISSLEVAGCSKIVIVLGHGHKEIEKAIRDSYKGNTPLVFVFNERFNLSNGVSVLSASDHLGDLFIMTMADHILGNKLMEIARNYKPKQGAAALLVDYKIDTIFDMDDATKVLSKDDKIVSIGKKIENFNCIDTGVFVCTRGILDALNNHFELNGDTSISEGVQDLAEKGNMHTVDVEDGFWQDVDTPEMLQYAEKILST